MIFIIMMINNVNLTIAAPHQSAKLCMYGGEYSPYSTCAVVLSGDAQSFVTMT